MPKPDQVVAAAGNLARRLVYGGVADLRPTSRVLVEERADRALYRYGNDTSAGDLATTSEPVLLVPPVGGPARAYDLRRGCSLAEHLAGTGRPTYLIEYGEVPFEDDSLDIDPWVEDVVPAAIRRVSRAAGGKRVHVVGWSLGGTIGLLAAARRPRLPIASLATLGSPGDLTLVPMVAPARPLIDLSEHAPLGTVLDPLSQFLGEWTRPLRAWGSWATQQWLVQHLLLKPLAIAAHLDDADYLAQLEAVDRLADEASAYHGRHYGQLYHRFVPVERLHNGELSAITAPVLVVAGATDGITPPNAVKPLVDLIVRSREARFEIVPGGHLGLLTGRAARESTWPVLDDWFAQFHAPTRRQPTSRRENAIDSPPPINPA